MHSYGFKVVPPEGGDGRIPVHIAGQMMVNIQSVLTEIASTILRTEFRSQGDLPVGIVSRYMLTIGGTDKGGVGSDPGQDGRELLEGCLEMLCYTLDFMGKGVIGTWMTDNFKESLGRRRVAEALVKLADDLDGYTLVYGEAGKERTFTKLNRDKLMDQIHTDSARTQNVARIGRLQADPVRKGKYLLTNGAFTIPADFANIVSPQGKSAAVDMGLGVFLGNGEMDHSGSIVSMKSIEAVHPLNEIQFTRIISSTRDIKLAVPIKGFFSVDRTGKNWTGRNDDLGIDVTKNSWDECVLAFHDYFVFLWENYVESGEEFEGEEKDIRDLLISYTPLF